MTMKNLLRFLFLFPVLLLASCSGGYEPIHYGEDACAHCRMTIVDKRFAAEMVTAKGRAYKFDDVLCLKQYLATVPQEQNYLLFVNSFLHPDDAPLDAQKIFYLKHDFFKSPMNGNYGAFKTHAEGQQLADSLNVPFLTFDQIQ